MTKKQNQTLLKEQPEKHLKCSMLIFSVGAYLETVIPAVDKWVNGSEIIHVGDKTVVSERATVGYDENQKHIQTIIKFKVHKDTITVTCYNTTQKKSGRKRVYQVYQ